MAESTTNFQWAAKKVLATSFASLPTDVQLDQPFTSLKYLHRQWNDADLYFFFNESDQPVTRNANLKGSGTAMEWNAQDGTIKEIKAKAIKNEIQLPLQLKPYETKFIVVQRH